MSKSPSRKPRRRKNRVAPPESTTDAIIETQDEQSAEQSPEFIEHDERHALVRERAYYLAEQRGFEPGHEVNDWLAAERDVERSGVSNADEEGPTPCGD